MMLPIPGGIFGFRQDSSWGLSLMFPHPKILEKADDDCVERASARNIVSSLLEAHVAANRHVKSTSVDCRAARKNQMPPLAGIGANARTAGTSPGHYRRMHVAAHVLQTPQARRMDH
jgi:hypothetical protein